jgi:hypothetical protein
MLRVGRALKITAITVLTLVFALVLTAQCYADIYDDIRRPIVDLPDMQSPGIDDLDAQPAPPPIVAPSPVGGGNGTVVVQAIVTSIAPAPRPLRILSAERLIALGYWAPLSWLANNPATAPPARA